MAIGKIREGLYGEGALAGAAQLAPAQQGISAENAVLGEQAPKDTGQGREYAQKGETGNGSE